MFVTERFLFQILDEYGKHNISTEMEVHGYPSSLQVFKDKTIIFIPHEKSIIERTMQYIKDRTEGFDDYFPCKKKERKLKHVKNWLNLFVDYHRDNIDPINYISYTSTRDI